MEGNPSREIGNPGEIGREMAHGEKTLQVFCIGTADTKLDELRFLYDRLRSDLDVFSKGSSIKVYVISWIRLKLFFSFFFFSESLVLFYWIVETLLVH